MNDELYSPFWLLSPLAVLGAGLMVALVMPGGVLLLTLYWLAQHRAAVYRPRTK